MTVLRSGVNTFVSSVSPSKSFATAAAMRLKSGTETAYGLIQFGLPLDLKKGSVVLSAKLRVSQSAAWSGSITTTATVLTGKWSKSTVTYNNRPAASGSTSVTQAGGAAGTVVEFDVTGDVQAWVDGVRPNYGWRLSTSSTVRVYLASFTAAAYKPTLEVTYATPPTVPTSLHPSAGAVSVAKPTLTFSAGDITALQVQVDPAANGTTPAFDSGEVTTTLAQYALGTSAYAGLALSASTQWRVRVKNATGLWSSWSQWATFSRVAKPTLTITQPTGTVLESTPPLAMSMTGLTSFRWTIANASSPQVLLYDSGRIVDTSGTHTPTKPVMTTDGAAYVVTAYGYDAVVREATPGDPPYSVATVTTTLDYDSTVSGVAYASAAQKTIAPWVDLTWSRAVQPDGWAIIRNGVTIHTEAVANDLIVSGSTYTWRDWTAPPNVELVYRVAPVVNGVTSSEGPLESVTMTAPGVWLGDPETGREVVLFGADDAALSMVDEATIYNPVGSSASVRVVTGLRGYEGTVTGTLEDAWDYSPRVQKDLLLGMKAEPATVFRLVVGDLNIPVVIGNVNVSPIRRGITTDGNRQAVSVDVWQTGELPFEAL